jgi:CheY-like chemotaxis protein
MLALCDLVLAGPLEETQRARVLALREAAEHLRATATTLLERARAAADPASPSADAPFDLAALLDTLADGYAARAAAQDLGWEVSREGDFSVSVSGDAVRLRAMIENLADNAFKVTQQGAVRLHAVLEPQGEQVRLRAELHDSGPGLPPAGAEPLFAPYVTGDVSRGAGLGLAVLRAFAEAMGGRVFAHDGERGGAVFGFEVPLRRWAAIGREKPLPAAASGPLDAGPAAKPLTVLVAEDNPANRQVLSVLVERFGHRALVAGDGAEALARIEAGGVDLVLMDAEMPVLDGLAATRAIRALAGPLSEVPVIGVTAHVVGAHGGKGEARFLEAGADAVIAKPLDVADLLSAIAAVVSRRP